MPLDRREGRHPSRPAQRQSARRDSGARVLEIILAAALALGELSLPLPALAWGGKVNLSRRYRPGQVMVYHTTVHTQATVQSDPPTLKSFLPPVPTEFTLRQQCTIRIKAVRPDGSADLETRFDRFEIQSDLPQRVPENLRDSTEEEQRKLGQQMEGRLLTARYDRAGQLLEFGGGDELLQQFDAPFREPLRQALRLLLEQTGGSTLYPDHPVKPGEEWKHKLDTAPTQEEPYKMEGENRLHYSGKRRYGGVKAAAVDFHFSNQMTPALDRLREVGPLTLLEAQGMQLDIRIDGQGEGRAVLALDDGRVLQNHVTLHQTLSARLRGAGAASLSPSQPVQLRIDSVTRVDVEGSGK